jgi:hypothetical protein
MVDVVIGGCHPALTAILLELAFTMKLCDSCTHRISKLTAYAGILEHPSFAALSHIQTE